MRLTTLTFTVAVAAAARSGYTMHGEAEFIPEQPFALETAAVGGVAPARGGGTQSSRIAALGDRTLVIDADSGRLVLADARGGELAHADIAADAGLLAVDASGTHAWVADRRADRIIAFDIGATSLVATRAWHTPAEPYALALAPDGATLLATAIADRVLVAYDPATGHERWRAAIDAEPRGIAVSSDGTHAALGALATGAIDIVDLATHAVERRALPARFEANRSRGAFALAYLGNAMIVSPFQRETPQPRTEERQDHYGGASLPPIEHALAMFGADGRTATAQIDVVEPRAVAWDATRDALYVAGMASDSIVQIVRASQVDVAAGTEIGLGGRCGADGLATTPTGDVLVWCSFSRSIVRITGKSVAGGPSLAPSTLDAVAHEGMQLFHSADANIADNAMLTCGTCHLDGRSDGLSWRIHGDDLQTPILAGRLVGTAPFKWDGKAKTLTSSLRATIKRLGGDGLSKRHLAALVAYLETVPAVRTPTRDAATVARGRERFESAELGCTSCHDGAMLTDQQLHRFGNRELDTPSLVGLAASAPYFHDGSAPTLEALLRDRGHVHGMASDATRQLDDTALADLRAYLETR